MRSPLSAHRSCRIGDYPVGWHHPRIRPVVQTAALSFLIDAGIASIEGVIERIGVIHKNMPASFHNDDTKSQVAALAEWLRSHKKPDGPTWTPKVIEGGKDRPDGPPQED
jgi:hypothetical protein